MFLHRFGDDKVVFLRENCEVIQDKTVVSVELSSESPVLNNPLNNKAFHLQLVQSGINAIKRLYAESGTFT